MSLNEECIMKIFSERWDGATGKNAGRNGANWDEYKIKRIKTGWNIKHIAINGDCDKSGEPFLYQNLRQDFISYPYDLPIIMESLWELVENEKLNHEQLQHELDKISNWISECEMNKPHFLSKY